MLAAIHYKLGGGYSLGGKRMVCTISRLLTPQYLKVAEEIHVSQNPEVGPGVDTYKAADQLDIAYRQITEISDDLDANPGQAAAAANNTKLGLVLNQLRGVSRGAHVMCGTAEQLADVVDSGVLLQYVIQVRMGLDLPKPAIDVARAGIILMKIWAKGAASGYW